MARSERNGLIKEEQLGPAPPGHDRSAAAFVLTAADEPSFGGPTPIQQGLRSRLVDDAAIAGEYAPLGYGKDLTEGCNTILKRHSHLSDKGRSEGFSSDLHRSYKTPSQSKIVNGPQLSPATKIASNCAGSVALGFSAKRWIVPGGSNHV
jgi:hypothetical protein